MSTHAYAGTAAVVARFPENTSLSAADLTLLSTLCDQTNDYIEQYVWRPIGPTDGGTAVFDSREDVYAGTLHVRQGIRSIDSMTVAPSTGVDPVTVTVADVIILPRAQNRRPGWPGFDVLFKDSVVGPVSSFGRGYADITIVGNFGWEAIPPSLKEVAELTVIRAWHGRMAGQADIVGSEPGGEPTISRYVSARDKMTLRSFRPAGGLVAG